MDNERKRISILGSTGSIGRSALEVVRQYPELFEVTALAAGSNADVLEAQIREFRPAFAAISDAKAGEDLRGKTGETELWVGEEALERAAEMPVDTALCAVVGAVGLRPLLRAIESGNRVAVANKEPFVMAGRLVMETARRHDVEVLPVDSEHNAIFQCLHGHEQDTLRCIHLTASGGPFYGRPRESLRGVMPEEATNHPTWDMGAKISVDSATLMNKGLEIIEAMWLFGVEAEQIEVVIHPQSIVHSLVEFSDGHMLAHLGVTDMKFPILFALTWPNRVRSPMRRLNLAEMGALTFARPDFSAFPCLGYARAAAAQGGTAPAILNAANEVAVAAFCGHRIPFLAISDVVGDVLETCVPGGDDSLEIILEADGEARRQAAALVGQLETS